MICYIVGALACRLDFKPQEGDLVIAADRGLAVLCSAGITPHLTVGDFDSLGEIPQVENLAVYPCEKDDTDMMLACKAGLERGFRDYRLYGGIGGRLDHTLANIQTLAYLKAHGAFARLVGEREECILLENETLILPPAEGRLLSVFAYGGEATVTLKGLKYTLEHGALTDDFPLGVSNVRTSEDGSICAEKGRVLVVIEEAKAPLREGRCPKGREETGRRR